MKNENAKKITTVNELEKKLRRMRLAQEKFASFSQEQVDRIFFEAAMAANKARIPLAKMAVAETGMGVVEDKVIKNHYAAEYIYHAYRSTKTCGVIEEDPAAGIMKIAEPIGLIAAVIPTTNPTSTAIFKTLICLKTSLDMTNLVMRECDCILATGGPGMVRAAYSSGKPALGVGAGNTPAIIDSSADVRMAVNSIIHSKTFDNGMICASEQSVTVLEDVYEEARKEFEARGCYFLDPKEARKVGRTIIINGAVNAKIVGQTAAEIAKMAGIEVPERTKVLIGEVTSTRVTEPFAHEKLSPVLGMYKAGTFEEALDIAEKLVMEGGPGHTSSLFINPDEKEKIRQHASLAALNPDSVKRRTAKNRNAHIGDRRFSQNLTNHIRGDLFAREEGLR